MLTRIVQRLKSALWYSIGSTIDAISLEQNINATPQFIGALTEVVWTQIANSSLDMERFAKYVLTHSPFRYILVLGMACLGSCYGDRLVYLGSLYTDIYFVSTDMLVVIS